MVKKILHRFIWTRELIRAKLSPAIFVHKKWVFPESFLLWFLGKREIKRPDDLTIVLVHDYNHDPLTVKSLKYSGLKYVELKPKEYLNHSVKIKELYKWLPKCKTKYVLYLDAADVIVRRSLDNLPKGGMVFSLGKGGLSAGIFYGETEYVKKVIEEVLTYDSDNDQPIFRFLQPFSKDIKVIEGFAYR